MSPIPFVILAVLGVGFYAWYSDKKRKEGLAAWAMSKGWQLRLGKLKGLDQEYPGLKLFGKGQSRSASNVINGQHRGLTIRLMDYKYVTGSGKNRSTHKVGVALIQTEYPVIPLTIRRENPFDKVGEFLGADDIDFESAEFSRKFYVKSHDRKWAYDVIHQRAMDYLLASPSYSIAFGFQEILVTKSGNFGPDSYEEALDLAVGLYELIPEYVIEQMKGQAR